MLKTISLLLKTMQSPINKPQRRLPSPWSWKNWKNDKNAMEIYSMETKKFFSSLLSNPWCIFMMAKIHDGKIHDGKKLKTIPLPLKTKQ